MCKFSFAVNGSLQWFIYYLLTYSRWMSVFLFLLTRNSRHSTHATSTFFAFADSFWIHWTKVKSLIVFCFDCSVLFPAFFGTTESRIWHLKFILRIHEYNHIDIFQFCSVRALRFRMKTCWTTFDYFYDWFQISGHVLDDRQIKF